MQSLIYAKKQYQHGKRLGASHKQTVLSVYSEAISACFEEDALRAIKALAALQLSLNPNEATELSDQLNHIFDYCIKLIQEQDFTNAAETLIELRSTLTS